MSTGARLYPGITSTAAARLARIAGSYESMSEQEQLAFTEQLRAARLKGKSARAIKKGESNNEVEEIESSEPEG